MVHLGVGLGRAATSSSGSSSRYPLSIPRRSVPSFRCCAAQLPAAPTQTEGAGKASTLHSSAAVHDNEGLVGGLLQSLPPSTSLEGKNEAQLDFLLSGLRAQREIETKEYADECLDDIDGEEDVDWVWWRNPSASLPAPATNSSTGGWNSPAQSAQPGSHGSRIESSLPDADTANSVKYRPSSSTTAPSGFEQSSGLHTAVGAGTIRVQAQLAHSSARGTPAPHRGNESSTALRQQQQQQKQQHQPTPQWPRSYANMKGFLSLAGEVSPS
jgi:hypothetical protein